MQDVNALKEAAEAPVDEEAQVTDDLDEQQTEDPDIELEADGGEDGGEPQEPAPVAIDPSVEKEARDMGWVPEEEWRGNKDAWRPADEFVKRGQEVLPIVRSNLERERRKTTELERRMADKEAEFEKRIKRMEAMNVRGLELQRQKFYEELELRKEQAVAEGDTEEYRRLKKEQMDGLAQFDEPEDTDDEPPQNGAQAPLPQAVTDWVAKETWFTNPQMAHVSTAAQYYHAKLMNDMPGLPLEENLERVSEYVRSKYPEEFGIDEQKQATPAKPKPHAPSIEGGGRQPSSSGNKRGWNDLPQEAKEAGQRYVDKGYFGDDKKAARQKYAAEYWSQ